MAVAVVVPGESATGLAPVTASSSAAWSRRRDQLQPRWQRYASGIRRAILPWCLPAVLWVSMAYSPVPRRRQSFGVTFWRPLFCCADGGRLVHLRGRRLL